MGFGAKVEAWSNPVVATPQPRPSCQETSHNHDAFLPLAQCGCLQKGGPLLPSWPTVPATSAQTVFFLLLPIVQPRIQLRTNIYVNICRLSGQVWLLVMSF